MLDQPLRFPKSALFDRIVHKNKIYLRSRVSSRVKELFVEEIEKIQWKYKLSPKTINLPATEAVQEFQIFEIGLKQDRLSIDVLRTIDRSVPSPIIFMLTTETHIMYTACYKRPNAADRSNWVISDYFETDWIVKESTSLPLPVVLTLEALYEKLIEGCIPYGRRENEPMTTFIQRVETINRLNREIGLLEKRMKTEKQFNRRVELNHGLRELALQRDRLIH